MTQIRAKQIRLENEGDLIIGNSQNNGSILPRGSANQVLHVVGSTLAWQWTTSLYDVNGVLVLDSEISTGGVNYVTVEAGTPGNGPTISVMGPGSAIDLNLAPVGTGEILAPSGYTQNIISENAIVTKGYVDSVAAGLDWKNSVRAATTNVSELSGFTYVPGNEPNGNVWTGVINPVFDGYTIQDGDRVIIKNASDQRGNGIFVYNLSAQSFVRADDANNTPNNEVSMGMAAFVETGSTLAGTAWVVTSPDTTAVLGTDNIVWTQFAGSQLYIAGSGLSLIGNTFSVNESSTIAVISDSVVVNSSNIQNQVLLSQGSANVEAVWGALPLGDSNAVTGVLNVQNGGTGLNSVPNQSLLVGTGTSALATLAVGPSSTSALATVLVVNSSGEVAWSNLTLDQLSDVNVNTATSGDILYFNGLQWVNTSFSNLDVRVAVSAGTTPGYLSEVLDVASSSGVEFQTSANTMQLRVRYDDITIRLVNNDLSVAGGLENQVLIGTGTTSAASWSYLDTLYNQSGQPLFNVSGSGNTLFYNSNTNTLQVGGGNLNIVATSGNIVLNGVSYPSPIPAHSLLVVNTDNVITPLTTGGSSDALLIYSATTSSFTFINVSAVGGDSYGKVQLLGNVSGVTILSALTNSDILYLEAGPGISFIGSAPSNLIIEFSRQGLVDTATELNDTLPFYDNSANDAPAYRSFKNTFVDLGVPYNLSALGLATQVSAGEWLSREIEASNVGNNLGIVVINGNGVSGNPTIGLSIVGLSATTVVSPSSAYFVIYDQNDDRNYRISVDDVFSSFGVGNSTWASANATGSVNEEFVGFFAQPPLPNSIVVYFNGLALRSNGYVVSGTNLTLVDAVNGYSTDSGDVITAQYQY